MKWEKLTHKIVSQIIEICCVIILVIMGYFIWDTISVEHSAKVDDYVRDLRPTFDDSSTQVDLSALQEINPDVVGWLTIDDTNIDYPILQGDPDYTYLNRDIEGNRSLTGSIYISFNSNRYFEDDYTIIYGHHMQGGVMFGALDYYEDETYLNEHLTGTLITENKIYDLYVQALIYTDAYNDIYRNVDNEHLNAFVNSDEYEIHTGNIDISDKTLLLSTCGPYGSTDRIILIINMEER